MDIWTFVTSTLCGVVSLVPNQNVCHMSAQSSIKNINNQVHIVPVGEETNSYLPLAVQIVSNMVDQTLNTELKQIVYDSFISKELSSFRPTTHQEDDATMTETESTATSTPVETRSTGSSVSRDEARSESESFKSLRDKYETQLKHLMVSELFALQSEGPIGEELLFKRGDGGRVVYHEMDALPGSKQDSTYWQPDVNKLLDSIKVAEMFRQISPELIWLGELRDHLISEAIHRRLRYTSGFSRNIMQSMYQMNNVSAKDQMMFILKKILETKDISEPKTDELTHKIISLLESPNSKLSQATAHCLSIRYS